MHEHIPSFIELLKPTIDKYGYLAVFGLVLLEDFGVPSPGETILIAGAFFAGLGQLNILAVAVVAFIGAVIGDSIGFAIGEYGGHPLAEKYGKYIFLTPARIKKAEDFYNRQGGKVVAGARFIEGLRQVNGLIAGISEMRWTSFLMYNAIGAALWASVWSLVGYYGGRHIDTFLKYDLYLTIAVVVLVVSYVAYRLIKRQRKERAGNKL